MNAVTGIRWQLPWHVKEESVLFIKNMSIGGPGRKVDKVKRSENGVITDPFYLSPGHIPYSRPRDLMAKFRISVFRLQRTASCVGIITNRDLKFETN